MTFQIREAAQSDLENILKINKLVNASSWKKVDFESEWKIYNSMTWIIFDDDNGQHIGGFLIFRVFDSYIHIVLIAINKAHQRKGLARELIKRLENTYKSVGYLFLEVRKDNHEASAFYANIGFVESERSKNNFSANSSIELVKNL